MSSVHSSFCQDVKARLEQLQLEINEQVRPLGVWFSVRHGASTGILIVYNTNTIEIGGKPTPELRSWLERIKDDAVRGVPISGHPLPGEIAKWPGQLSAEVADLDPIILQCFVEAIKCVQADILLASSFMLGAASERAIDLLIEGFGDSISDEYRRSAFQAKISSKRSIKTMFDEFKSEYKKINNPPDEPELSNVIEVIEATFHNLRLTRNEIGHLRFLPDLDKTGVLAQLDHFRKHIRRIVKLQAYFTQNGVMLG